MWWILFSQVDCFLRKVDRELTMSHNIWVSGPLCHLHCDL